MPVLEIQVEEAVHEAIQGAGAEGALEADSIVLMEIIKWSLQSIGCDIREIAEGCATPESIGKSVGELTQGMEALGVAATKLAKVG